MELHERDEALTRLEELFGRTLQGRGGVAVISGALGTGKTALLHAFAERLVKAGGAFLPASASHAERNHPLAVLNQLFEPAAGLGRSRSDTDCPDPDFRAVHQRIDEFARRHPTVVGVDDVQFADPASLQGLLYLARRLRSSRVLLVICARADWVHLHQRFHAEVSRLANSVGIRLPLLSRSGVAAVLAEYLDRHSADRLSAACHRASGGNPLLAHALAEDCRSAASAEPQLVLGDNFSRAVLGCLHRGESPMLETARAHAVLGERASPSLVSRLLGVGGETVSYAVDGLTAAGLMPAGHFHGDGARAAILGAMGAEEKRPLHRRAAQLLHDDGAPPSIVADELVAADGAEDSWAVPLLRTAADHAMIDGELDRSVEWLKLAHRACTDPSDRAVIAARLADALWRVDPASAAAYLPELVAATRGGLLNGPYAALPFFHLLWLGRTDAALDYLRTLTEADDGTPSQIDKALVADFLRLWLPVCYPGLARRLPEERRTAVVGTASALAAPYRAAAALAGVLAGGPADTFLDEAEHVLSGTRLTGTTLMSVTTSLLALHYGERGARGAFWCDALLQEATQRRMPMWQALFATIRAGIHFRAGELAQAGEQSRAALSLVPPDGWGAAIGAPLACGVLVATATGRYEQAAAYLDVAVPEATFQTPCGVHYLGARGDFYLATGRFHAALADFRACGRLLSQWGIDLPAIVPWRVECARAYLCLDDVKQARVYLTEQLARLDGEPSRIRGLTVWTLAATNDVEDRVPLLREALDIFLAHENPLDVAYVLADLSDTYQKLADYKGAQVAARSAVQFAERCGAEGLRQSLIARYGQADGRTAAPTRPGAEADTVSGWIARLSRAERKVALLAADGYTNRQIAQRLSISVSTVEQHMTRVYRKLEVDNRSHLWPRLHVGLAARAG